MKTFSLKGSDVKRNWILLDASEAPLGRLASLAAQRLSGKYKPTFTPSMDDGDFVVIINTDKLKVSGNKQATKMYYSHSGYPGGISSKTLDDVLKSDSTKAVYQAVKGMLPKNKLQPERLNRLKLFTDMEHAHTAQKPVKLELK